MTAPAGGKRLARNRRRTSRAPAAAAATPTAVRFRLHQIVEGDGQLRAIIVEVAGARAVSGELG